MQYLTIVSKALTNSIATTFSSFIHFFYLYYIKNF
nr:MAG TPA: hypothetical protein [Caudoviricetes sp.]